METDHNLEVLEQAEIEAYKDFSCRDDRWYSKINDLVDTYTSPYYLNENFLSLPFIFKALNCSLDDNFYQVAKARILSNINQLKDSGNKYALNILISKQKTKVRSLSTHYYADELPFFLQIENLVHSDNLRVMRELKAELSKDKTQLKELLTITYLSHTAEVFFTLVNNLDPNLPIVPLEDYVGNESLLIDRIVSCIDTIQKEWPKRSQSHNIAKKQLEESKELLLDLKSLRKKLRATTSCSVQEIPSPFEAL
jgi:hypothetical protein